MKPKEGISVDGSCLGNPGPCEYRGLDIKTGDVIFASPRFLGTNNVAEFLAIVHALMHCKKNNIKTTIYSDSQTALSWVFKNRIGTKLEKEYTHAWSLIERSLAWLNNNRDFCGCHVKKWETKKWGECPSDFGRKKIIFTNN